MKTKLRLLGNVVFAALIAACSSPSPSTSSSSHWATCKVFDDCTDVPRAVMCTSGYCVDSSGGKLAASTQPSDDGGSGYVACDPLTPHELPVTLGTVLGVGKDSAGKTYLADEVTTPSQTDRVFVSDGSSLFRKRVTGSGQNGGGADTDYSLSFEDGANTPALLIQIRGGKTTGMGLGSGGKQFFGDPGAVTTDLTVEDPKVVQDFTLRNLPGDVTIEYVAKVDGGEALVVTRPTDDWTYTDFRLFFGGLSTMDELPVKNVTRARSGGTTIEFFVADATWVATFPFTIAPGPDGGVSSHPDPGTLDEAGKVVGLLQTWPTPKTLDGFSFRCSSSQKRQ